ncbi:hypothetical protein GKE82_09580 [Conexibacter sp. W3-3-2]|uniref:PAAR motif protein n=1 Tax=Paraconexibacter algicola TaxID=2133960 RepID=A0A2T4UGA4_9ACTN|nr:MULTISPECIES: hypothetical protein [Solirubrobacterales]MTD44534.1 hypothetical protein [Conexibacter sp. W3-3-2]PTL58283.1 hypothetical protein C7Y72_00780 [Paraconexibacter algicola]
MPAPVLTASAKIMCPHGGQVTLIPKQMKVLANGSPVLCLGDVAGSPIVGCTLPPTPATVPCTVVATEIPVPKVGMNPQVMVNGKPVLLQGLQGLTNSVPPGPFIVAFPGQTKVMA